MISFHLISYGMIVSHLANCDMISFQLTCFDMFSSHLMDCEIEPVVDGAVRRFVAHDEDLPC